MQNMNSQIHSRVKINSKVVLKMADGSGYKITQEIEEEIALRLISPEIAQNFLKYFLQ